MPAPFVHGAKRTLWLMTLALLSMLPAAFAQSFPSKPIQFIVTGAPGASSDLIARRLAKVMQAQTGANFVIENKGGASGSIGLLTTIRAPADGHTLVIAVPDSVTVYPLLKKNRPYSVEKDLTPVAQVAEAHFVFAVNTKNPANNMAEFIANLRTRSKDNPAKYASPGNGTSARLVTEMLMQRTQLQMLHVPYRSTGPGLQDLAGGEVDLMATSIASAKALMDSGHIKAIGITRDKRLPGFDKIPTLVENGFPDFVVPVWWGIFAAANLPADVREKLSSMVLRAAESDEFRAQLVALGLEPRIRSSAEFDAFLRPDSDMWSSAIRKAQIPLED